jgi:hypothetical protein
MSSRGLDDALTAAGWLDRGLWWDYRAAIGLTKVYDEIASSTFGFLAMNIP